MGATDKQLQEFGKFLESNKDKISSVDQLGEIMRGYLEKKLREHHTHEVPDEAKQFMENAMRKIMSHLTNKFGEKSEWNDKFDKKGLLEELRSNLKDLNMPEDYYGTVMKAAEKANSWKSLENALREFFTGLLEMQAAAGKGRSLDINKFFALLEKNGEKLGEEFGKNLRELFKNAKDQPSDEEVKQITAAVGPLVMSIMKE